MTLKEKRILTAYEFLNTLYQMKQTEEVQKKIKYYEAELEAELEDEHYESFTPNR